MKFKEIKHLFHRWKNNIVLVNGEDKFDFEFYSDETGTFYVNLKNKPKEIKPTDASNKE